MYIPLSQRQSQNPQSDIDSIMADLARIESGGAYDALGPTVEKGMYAGEQALGKYQVMPGNIPSWSKEVLGYEISPEEFLADPDLQERLVRGKIEDYYKRYGNRDDVASVWFTGRPVSEAGDAADVTGTSNTEYLRRFNQSTPVSSTNRVYVPLSERSSRMI